MELFVVWHRVGHRRALFDADNKIVRQNIAYTSTPYLADSVQAAWDNHFAAFGGQDIDRIMLDYNEDSVLMSYETVAGELTTKTGVAGIREFVEGLFAALSNTSSLTAPVVEVTPQQVYLVWTCPSSGVQSATDTFIFAADNTISRQNIVWTAGNALNAYAELTDVQEVAAVQPLTPSDTYSKPDVQSAWDNHFAAFGGQNVPAIMKDYTQDSVLKAFDHSTGALLTAAGYRRSRVSSKSCSTLWMT